MAAPSINETFKLNEDGIQLTERLSYQLMVCNERRRLLVGLIREIYKNHPELKLKNTYYLGELGDSRQYVAYHFDQYLEDYDKFTDEEKKKVFARLLLVRDGGDLKIPGQ